MLARSGNHWKKFGGHGTNDLETSVAGMCIPRIYNNGCRTDEWAFQAKVYVHISKAVPRNGAKLHTPGARGSRTREHKNIAANQTFRGTKTRKMSEFEIVLPEGYPVPAAITHLKFFLQYYFPPKIPQPSFSCINIFTPAAH